jgi:flavin reductase (DIM6/NTAB) family NADH-FMN oxidoreductase RutF
MSVVSIRKVGSTGIDPSRFRHVLGHYPTGVCVITAMDIDDAPVGMVVGTFTSVSLDPPLVGFLPDRRSSTWARIARSRGFCVNILAEDQGDFCRRFAKPGDDKFEGVSYRVSRNGSPILPDVVAWIDCTHHSVHPAGDHDFVLGAVSELHVDRGGPPMLVLQGGFGCFAAPPQLPRSADRRPLRKPANLR